MTYNVSGMLAISEDQVPCDCEEHSAGARHGLPCLEAGAKGEALVGRVVTSRSMVDRVELDQRRTSLDSIGCAVVFAGSHAAIVIKKKQPV